MLFDAHAHLDDEQFATGLDGVVDAMAVAGIGTVVNAACDMASVLTSRALAERYPWCYFTVGIHPHYAEQVVPADYDQLFLLAQHPKCVAYGEIGLDFHYDFSPRDRQAEVFLRQLEVAHSLHLPVVLHIREAYQVANEILLSHKHLLTDGILLHCYSGSKELAETVYNGLDAYYSFGGAITFAKHKDEVLRAISVERILLETDCPYMTPVPLRGKRNDPSNIPLVRDKMAQLLGRTPEEIERITTANARRFYRLEA